MMPNDVVFMIQEGGEVKPHAVLPYNRTLTDSNNDYMIESLVILSNHCHLSER